MIEGQSIISFIVMMKEFKNQLEKMGETIADSSHAAILLRNLPDSWRSIAQMIRMITQVPDKIEERLDAHEADLNAIEISSQAATAFIAQYQGASKSTRPPPPSSYNNQNQCSKQTHQPIRPPYYHCNNCGKEGHSASRCYAPGGGLAGRTPWKGNQGQFNNSLNWKKIANYNPQNPQNPPQYDGATNSAHLAGNDTPNIIMMARKSRK